MSAPHGCFGPGITWRLAGKVRPDRAQDARRTLIAALGEELRRRDFIADGTALVVDPSVSARPPAA